MRKYIINTSIGFIDNIVYDFHRGKLTPKYEIKAITDGLCFEDSQKIIYWWNKASKDGIKSIAHLKLMYVAVDLIKKYLPKSSITDIWGLTDSKRYL